MCLQHEVELAIVARALIVTVPPEPVAPLGREDCLPRALHRRAARRIHEIATLLGKRVAGNGPPGGEKSRPPNLLLLLTPPPHRSTSGSPRQSSFLSAGCSAGPSRDRAVRGSSQFSRCEANPPSGPH